jgi:hypothetical protein
MMKDARDAHHGVRISSHEITGGYGGLIIALAAAFAALYAAMYVAFPLVMELVLAEG